MIIGDFIHGFTQFGPGYRPWIMMRVSGKTIERREVTVVSPAISQLSIEKPSVVDYFRGDACKISAVVSGQKMALVSCKSREFTLQVYQAITKAMAGQGSYLINIAEQDIFDWIEPNDYALTVPKDESLGSRATKIIRDIDIVLYYSEQVHEPVDVFFTRKVYGRARRYAHAIEFETRQHSPSFASPRVKRLRASAIRAFAQLKASGCPNPLPMALGFTHINRIYNFVHSPLPAEAAPTTSPAPESA